MTIRRWPGNPVALTVPGLDLREAGETMMNQRIVHSFWGIVHFLGTSDLRNLRP
jgi:hypothetical protein